MYSIFRGRLIVSRDGQLLKVSATHGSAMKGKEYDESITG
jgi:hypothetical protein